MFSATGHMSNIGGSDCKRFLGLAVEPAPVVQQVGDAAVAKGRRVLGLYRARLDAADEDACGAGAAHLPLSSASIGA